MLVKKLPLGLAVTILIVVFMKVDEVNAAPQPCRGLLEMFKKSEEPTTVEDKPEVTPDKGKRKNMLTKLEKLFEKMLRRALGGGDEETTEKPKGAMEEFLTGYINFLSFLWKL